ncbi:Aste57867_23155 [Aphanomyces stellatus]|uniref:Aste57867_23155 protein n=1 Tax=Aphanomyces stellatus TaxID=120398 RepID=A0A485LRM8_9STRA|nr:hypothetical protein As57867_023084 [Aphanomyces stellatus]VFT99803.1 Aste57867_23155 [Aphanomyces stellatus]
MSIVASVQGFKKNQGLLRPWRARQFTLLSDAWFLWDKEQAGTRGKCWDLVETVIGATVTKINQYYAFTVSFEDITTTLGFTTEAEAREWNDLMQEIADENAAGRREWTAGFKDAFKATDARMRRDLVLKIKPRDWNKEWQFCLRSQLGDGFSMQVRRMKRMYGLWLQFNQYALMLVDAIVNDRDADDYEFVSEPGEENWWNDPQQPDMVIYKYGPVIFKVAARHWSCYKVLRDELKFFGGFKELYDVFRTLATATLKGEHFEKFKEVQQLKFPLVSTLEMRDMRVAVFAQPIGDPHPVALQSHHIHTILNNLRFTRPTQVLDALAYHQLPRFSSIYRNTVSDDIYLMQIESPYTNVLRSSLRPVAFAGCFVSNDVTQPIQILGEDELVAMKDALEKSKTGLVHYLNMKGITNKFELLPYLDLVYFNTDIVSTAVNARASNLAGSKVYGDVVFTFNPEKSRLPLHLKEAYVLDASNDVQHLVSMLREPDIASSSIERFEAQIVRTMASTIAAFAARLVTLGDAIQDDATMTIQNTESAVDATDVIYVSSCDHLRVVMRDHGINMCFLPAVLGALSDVQTGVQTLVMSEIVARVAKHMMRYRLLQDLDKKRTQVAVDVFNAVMDGLTRPQAHLSQFWGVDLPVWCTLGPYSASISVVHAAVLDAHVYHARLVENPAPLYMAMLRVLRLSVTSRIIKRLLSHGNTLTLPRLHVEDIVSFQKTKLTAAWSNLQATELTSFTQQLLQLEKLYQTHLAPTRPSAMRPHAVGGKSKGDGYLELFRSVDERVSGAMEGVSDNVEEYGIERSILANLHKALAAARASDARSVRGILAECKRSMDVLPSHALVPVGVHLVVLFLETYLVETETPHDKKALVGMYIHAWKWLRMLYRPGNVAQLLIEASSHMMSLVVMVKLRHALKSHPMQQHVAVQSFQAMLSLLIKSMPPWQDLTKLAEPNYWFKKVEQHFLGLQSIYLPKALLHDIQNVPPFDMITDAFWATNGLAFIQGNVMGMSLDVEQRNIAQNHQRDPLLHAFTNATAAAASSSSMRTIELNLLRFPLPTTHRIQFVACGYRHAALISSRGELFTFGYGECGRLGHGDEEAEAYPRRVDFFDEIPVVQASCGREHTMVVAADQRLFGFGWGEAGRLGTGASGKCMVPQLVSAIPPVTKVACGREHTLALSTSGQLMAFGAGFGGRCGVGTEDDVELPMAVAIPDASIEFVAMAAGECHSAALDRDGNVYTWGFGGSGALGRGSLDNDLAPRRVPMLRAISVGCGAYHTVAVLDDGMVYGWGDALAGQLGDIAVTLGEMRTSPHKITVGQATAVEVNCGSFSTAVVTATGEVYHWGSPEAGNGAPLNKQDACPRRLDMPRGVEMGSFACGAYQMIVATRVAAFAYVEEK